MSPSNFELKPPNSYKEVDKNKKATGRMVSYAQWSVYTCINRHFRSKGDPTSFATESIDYTRE